MQKDQKLLDKFNGKNKEEILENLAILKAEIDKRKGFDLKKFCTSPSGVLYEKQYNSIMDTARFGTDTTTRRSGKTTGRVADHLNTAIKHPKTNSVFITTTYSNAKKIIFPILCDVARANNIKATANISDLSLEINGSMIYCAGVNNSQSIHNFRGMKLILASLDETQAMRSYVKELVNDVISPALFDLGGRLRVNGTPGPVPVGYFYDISHSKEWSHHFYSLFDNPFIEDQYVRLAEELQRRGVTIDDPSIQREFFGKWALDLNSLVIKYEEAKQHYDILPHAPWEYIIAADFGFDDADAIAVIAFSMKHPNAYLVEEVITTKQGITPLAEQIQKLITTYKPMKVLGDFGALGKKIAEELQQRFNIPIVAAEKTRKLEYIELLNDSLRTGRLKAKKGSRFAQDSMMLEWDRTNPEKPEIKDTFHSDIIDAVIYAHRELLHWLWKPEPIKAKPGSIEAMNEIKDDLWQEVRERLQREQNQSAQNDTFYNDQFDDLFIK